MKTFINHIERILKKDDRLWSKDEDKKLLKNKLVELVEKDDDGLLGLLVKDSKIRKQFFKKIGESTIFLKDDFIQFVTMNEFLPDSFTAFENKIGLTDNGKLLSSKDDISLVFPYKDCVLEGGQEKTDEKRDEIFYNTVLAPDEVDRLKEPKVFTNWKKYDSKGEHEVEEVSRDDNFIIKGNNLLALYSLLPKYKNKIKLIYIDPPYNTGGDEFRYNDKFNHSAWLVFMKNRLELAKELLRVDGVIFVQCDDNEQAYLKVLMDEIFGRENFIEVITVVNNPRGRDYGGVANMHEFINIFSKTSEYSIFPLEEKNKEFPYEDSLGGFEVRELRNRNTKFNDENRPNLLYPFYLNPKKQDENGFFEISLENKKGFVEVYPVKSEGIQTVWRWGVDKSKENLNKNICGKAMNEEGRYQIVEKYRKNTRMARSVWWDKEVNSERGTLHLKKLFNKKNFNNPKPEETLKRVIEMSTNEGDIVLDFFAGGGTTGAVAHKMNRTYILVEQMEYIKDVTKERLKKVINGEQGGISEAVNWKSGGSFVYAELLEWNKKYIDELEKAKTKTDIKKVYNKIKKEAFYKYQVETEKFSEKDLFALSEREQKKVLLDVLDMNHLYVNIDSIDDATFKVSKKDKELNKEFYGKK